MTMSMKSLMYMKGLGERLPPKVLDHFYTSLRICYHCYSLGHVSEIINVNEGPWRKATPKGSGSLPTPRSGFAATVIPWDIVLCNVKYKWNTDSCDSYLHVIMTLRPAALHSCPYGLILSFSLSRPASSMVWLLATLVFLLFFISLLSYGVKKLNRLPFKKYFNIHNFSTHESMKIGEKIILSMV